MSHHIANYTAEQAQFQELINTADNPNILMFQGASGSGKSHLIDHCLRTVPKDSLPVVQLRLQSGGETIPTLFNIIGSKIGRAKLPTFSQRLAGLIGKTAEADEAIWKMQLRRQLRKIGHNSDLDTRQDWYQQLTDSFFADAEAFDQPLLLALDTYEQSSSEFDQWFRDEFLYGVAQTPNLRVLVGGQTLPEPLPEWSEVATVQKLLGVTDAKEWMVWAEQNGIQVQSLEYLAGICAALEGKPSKIIQFLSTLPKQATSGQNGAESTADRRKRLRQSIAQAFDVDDLKVICFDMEIEFEDFSQKKKVLIVDFMRHLERVGRVEEFIKRCRLDRPHLEW